MKQRTLGNTDIKASPIALGTWAIGGGPWWGESDDQNSIRAIQESIDLGVNLIDTAPVYGFGRSESIVGKAIKGRRDKVVLATKCGIWWDTQEGEHFFDLEGKSVYRNLSPKTIRREIEYSLERLGVDYIDLYQTHWPAKDNSKYRLDDTVSCLVDLKTEGKIRAVGASNVSVEQMKVYLDAGALDSIQPRYSMLDRAIEKTLIPFCLEHNISTLAYSPLEQGLLTGTIDMNYKVESGSARSGIAWFEPENRKNVLALLSGWSHLTEKYNCTMGQLVIAWTVAQPGITFALCGARKADHAISNAAAAQLDLDKADIKQMSDDLAGLKQPATV